jgi:hypothetical protein
MDELLDGLIKSLGALRPMVPEFAKIDGRTEAAKGRVSEDRSPT